MIWDDVDLFGVVRGWSRLVWKDLGWFGVASERSKVV